MGETFTEKTWTDYYAAVAGRPPRETLVLALDRWQGEHAGAAGTPFAVDLGCGEGRDTVELLRRGFRVLAIDPSPTGLARLTARPDLVPVGRLATRQARMEDAEWEAADIVNASFALPFCACDRFPAFWRRLVASLRPGGRFAGQFFGPDDDWASPTLTILDRPALEVLLAPFELERFDEQNSPGHDAKGVAKHWHLFQVVARKR
ncbi:MAG: class I SAM-dependent methyltransferase [Alphaproteobacteria bacterium]|nr:class I SAM-dependent methyltransferase [Alphaproteobacteria bacterium]